VSVYADTSFLLSYFGQDAKTLSAHALASGWTSPPHIAWTPFGELEFNNAARALVFSGKLHEPVWRAMRLRVVEDLGNGVLSAQSLPDNFYAIAEAISAAHTVKRGTRTLDVLHVAAATAIGARTFLSFDLRQRLLAEHCSLRVLPVIA
jgi:predicted nucleic acid-binding protein